MLYRVNLVIDLKPYISLFKSFIFKTSNCINKTKKACMRRILAKIKEILK